MKKYLIYLFLGGFLFSCQINENKKPTTSGIKSDKIYQYSLFTALANKIYDGTVSVAEIKKKGDTGLGTFNGLDGEMIVSDGIVYQWTGSGEIRVPNDSVLVPFVVVSFFEEDYKLEIAPVHSYAEIKALIEKQMPSKNVAYTFKIHADFESIKCGSANKQDKPFTKTLSDALIDRPTFSVENISGTMVGFWYPEYIGKLNVPGFHLHFISDDKKQAGHVLDFKATNLKIGIDLCDGFDIKLPQTKAFNNAVFDLSQRYNNKK